MTEVVDAFVVGHWAVARKMMDRHVSRCTTNVLLMENEEAGKQPKEVYEQLLGTFSKEGDLILDIGSGNGKDGFVLLCDNHNTTGNPLLTVHSLIWHQAQANGFRKCFEILLFK